MDQIPRRSSLPLAEGTKQVAKKQTGRKGGTLATVRTKQGQVKTEKAAQSAKWDEEEWMLVPLQDYRLVPIFEEKQLRINLPRSASRLFCFSSLWTEDVVLAILDRSKVSLQHYWMHLAIRIHIHGGSGGKKSCSRDHWPLPVEIFKGWTMCYPNFVRIFCACPVDIHAWEILSKNASRLLTVGDHQAADEKQQKCRAEVNPVVSLVTSKKNAPVGNWFFQVCCRTPNGVPYMLKCRLAKVYKGDKKLSHWSKWVKAEGNNPVTFSDSLYVADETVRTFNNEKRLFSFSVSKHRFAHVQKKLRWNVQNISQYSVAWSLKLGMAMMMYLDPVLGYKAVLSNAYSLEKMKSVTSKKWEIPADVAENYVLSGLLPERPPSSNFLLASQLRQSKEMSEPPVEEVEKIGFFFLILFSFQLFFSFSL